MELQQFFAILRRQLATIVACTLTGALLGGLISVLMPKTYTATTETFFTVTSGDPMQSSAFAEGQLKSYAAAAESDLVLIPAAKSVGLTAAELADKVSLVIPSGTSIIELSASDPDPVRAAELANALTKHLQAAADKLSPLAEVNGKVTGEKAIKSTILSSAVPPETPATPHMPLNVAVGLLLGLGLGVVAALLRDSQPRRPIEMPATRKNRT